MSALLLPLERRLIGNLGHPRNVREISQALQADPVASVETIKHDDHRWEQRKRDLSDTAVLAALQDAETMGWAVNLGSHTDLAKVPGVTEKNGVALSMPDEMAEIYTRRLANDQHRWRQDGDLWLLTQDGLDKLHEPTNDAPPMTPSQVQATIDAEFARTVFELEYDEDGHLLTDIVGKLTLPVYELWLEQVVAECERVWNVRPQIPIAGGSQFSDFYEALLLNAENQKTALGAVVDPWFMALTTVAVTDVMTGSTITEANYTGYVRIGVPASSIGTASGAGGSVANTTAITYAACTALTSTVIGFAHCVAVTTGEVRKFGTTASTVISTTQTPATFAIGAYTTTIA